MSEDIQETDAVVSNPQATTSTHIVTADSVQAEEVPTIPLDSLQVISALQPAISIHSIAATRDVSTPTPLVAQSVEHTRSWSEWLQIWWEGARPAYFTLPLMPALLGSVLAWSQTISPGSPLGQFHLLHFIGTILVLLLIQAGANLVNDYYDYLRGVDTGNTLGPGGLLQQNLVKPQNVLLVGLVLLGIGAILGLLVAIAGGPLVYLFGLVGLLCAYFYSATSRSLSSLALGELVAFLLFGPCVTIGAYLVQVAHLSASAFAYSIPLGLLAAAVVHVNNMRDIEGDTQVHKHTLAAFLGLIWSRVWFLGLLLGAFVVITLLGVPHGTPHLILVVWWTFPLLVTALTGVIRTDTHAGFHLVMLQVLRLEVVFTLLLAAALLVLAFIPVLPHLPAHFLPF
ncbi:MAG TPA: 1,4-dihydroxy-2-naphthoate octaprenyltransferase [Ktedonobacteraceae bacterium]|jgi:1,4-dihydroxy-2-naphthoate octaprenyltransferase|nr:1,4-dihydroxy-2-naphthoate octaprenyltransferase [Ktedonobacteraceae bacterium]